MDIILSVEGGWVHPVPATYKGAAAQLPAQYQETLKKMLEDPGAYNHLAANPNGADEQKYSLTITDGDTHKDFTFYDSHLGKLPDNVSALITFLSGQVK